MSDIKTVTLDGAELKVEGLGGQNTVIVNRGSAALYASASANVTPDGDNTAAIPSGGIMNLRGTNGTVYLLGTGKVELEGTDYADIGRAAVVSSGGSGGGSGGGGGSTGGVSQSYVDNKATETLASAKTYTDEKIDEVRGEIPIIPNVLIHNSSNAKSWFKIAGSSLKKAYHSYIKGLFLITGDSFIDDSTLGSPIGNGFLTVGITLGRAPFGIINTAFMIENDYGTTLLNPENFKLLIKDNSEDDTYYDLEIWMNISAYTRVRIICHEFPELWTLSASSALSLPEGHQTIDCKCWQNSELSDLKAYIGYTDSDIYGLEADFENNKFTRLAGAVGKNPGADFDSINAFGGRRRCNVYTNGAVVYDSTDTDGWDTSVVDVKQRLFSVMVEQPKFYYKIVPLKTEKIEGADGYHLRKARYYISDTPKAGFKVHPAFIQDNREVDKIYLSAFEGSIWSTESGRLTEDEQIANFDTDVLTSITDVKPASGTTQALTRANARKLAQNRDVGWGIMTIQTLSATQLLFAIEYASFNSQAAIGDGIADSTEPIKTGSTSSLGNASGSVASGGVSYRGEENLWGNIWAFVDGINIYKSEDATKPQKIYIADNNFVEDKINASYEETNISPLSGTGYISAFGYSSAYDWVFFPVESNGSTSLPVGDKIDNGTAYGWKTQRVGGAFNYHLNAGLHASTPSNGSDYHANIVGARLIYIPHSETAAQEVTAND